MLNKVTHALQCECKVMSFSMTISETLRFRLG